MSKKSFILYIDALNILDEMSDKDIALLFKAMRDYHLKKEIKLTGLLKVVFKQFENQFSRDNDKYLEEIEKRRVAGRIGGLAKASNAKQVLASAKSAKQSVANLGDNVNVNVNDNVNDNKEIILYLNAKADRKYSVTGKETLAKIKARRKDGFVLADFKKVIDIKTKEWLNTEQDKYLRPETLFGGRFEGYLNQKDIQPAKKYSAKKEYDLNKESESADRILESLGMGG